MTLRLRPARQLRCFVQLFNWVDCSFAAFGPQVLLRFDWLSLVDWGPFRVWTFLSIYDPAVSQPLQSVFSVR
jgi:hypothetical protein